ncbi:VOC family protein [Kibdelosporangium philippinense]|uniref:VOC family protein n=1 Tax=Kibdelosporangium philippinense TaxID=211113 RepID=A0ABS8ZTS1_9PSEU|nr:VOC family protein [Kibdelosporangium philippinense]MCE7009828.1 VOC family protein [Kibdelosporangium philippinense]
MALDHLVYATPDLTLDLGIELTEGGQHLGLGTRNKLADLGGGAYLEVLGPDPDQPKPEKPRPFGFDELTEPKLITWAVRPDNLDETVARAKAKGYDLGPITEMARERPDGVLLRWRLTPLVDAGVPFLIDWGASPHPTESLPPGTELVSFTITHPNPAEIREKLAILGEEATVEQGEAGFVAVLRTPNGEVVLR